LLRQTLTDWVCELHNDAPGDDSPREVLEEVAPADSRIQYNPHPKNWGAVASFNHAFSGGPESYGSILEDDNWWEPGFLRRTLAALEACPSAALAWANMRLWQEEPDGHWTDTGRNIWQCPSGLALQCFARPVALQAVDALHSNGAMVYRAQLSGRALVPPQTPFDIIEPIRERLLPGSLIFVPEVLANFSIGRTTARSAEPAAWLQSQMLVTASFFARARLSAVAASALWQQRRTLKPRSTDSLLLAGLCGAAPFPFFRYSRPRDWLHFLPRAMRHPVVLLRGLRFRNDHAELWRTLQTGKRPIVDATPLVAKNLEVPIECLPVS
jgi:hypothetical protein